MLYLRELELRGSVSSTLHHRMAPKSHASERNTDTNRRLPSPTQAATPVFLTPAWCRRLLPGPINTGSQTYAR
ncbi:hypothetical protein OH76DRAFT_1407755 [Lentinus brumalis]|uniref:Uncharacterized protein n=1 Tax=Lentinus brumalis TaxID=2498619 RepID=A0A371CZQ4_9APHY|nr:hypothetical protein OH76DRAFT_1407755 [Polyporus brumalis]